MFTDEPHLWIMLGYNRDTFYPLQTPRSGQNAKTSGEAIRDEFKDYFITKGALE